MTRLTLGFPARTNVAHLRFQTFDIETHGGAT
jgi:hypothetical protein